MRPRRGALVLMLHAHLPWVRHPEHPFFLEEHWLFEAVVETYLPLLESCRAMVRDGVPFRLTVDVSPTLAAMLADPLLRKRTTAYIDRLLDFLPREAERAAGNPALAKVVAFYRERLTRLRRLYVKTLDRDILAELSRLARDGVLELAACPATHPLLPLLMDRPALLRGQIRTAVREHERVFGVAPRGVWLPECAYAPPLERYLAEADLRWFVVDAHAFDAARPRPAAGVHAPLSTEYGVAAFARDIDSARQVWSAQFGYPGDPLYREFYRDAGWDLPADYVAPIIDPSGERMFTGLKYHRVTDRAGSRREIYDPEAARARADLHAGHFFDARVAAARALAARLGRPPVVVCPYDAELFGHWWFEGPWFLEQVVRKMAYDQDELELATPSDVLGRVPERSVASLEASSWGAGGYFEMWLTHANEGRLPALAAVEDRFLALLAEYEGRAPFVDRVLKQMAREVMLAEASDWAFLAAAGTASSYAQSRFRGHVDRFAALDRMLSEGALDEALVAECERRDPLFPSLDLADFV